MPRGICRKKVPAVDLEREGLAIETARRRHWLLQLLWTSTAAMLLVLANPPTVRANTPTTPSPAESRTASTQSDLYETATLRGEVVEMGCFVIGNRHGPKHRQCAIASARAGQDLGVHDAETGIVYVEIRDQEQRVAPSQLQAHIAKQVEVRGQIVSAGSVQGIAINRVRELD